MSDWLKDSIVPELPKAKPKPKAKPAPKKSNASDRSLAQVSRTERLVSGLYKKR